jgi:hypothetical protein
LFPLLNGFFEQLFPWAAAGGALAVDEGRRGRDGRRVYHTELYREASEKTEKKSVNEFTVYLSRNALKRVDALQSLFQQAFGIRRRIHPMPEPLPR